MRLTGWLERSLIVSLQRNKGSFVSFFFFVFFMGDWMMKVGMNQYVCAVAKGVGKGDMILPS